jgi:[ribosomal protein S5]-alanine N-acetyltransferase
MTYPLFLPDKIDTARLILQRLRYEDAEEIFYVYASKAEATKFVSWPTHSTLYDTNKYLQRVIPLWNSADYAFTVRLKRNGRLLGSIGLMLDNSRFQLGYIFGPLHWGQGYATEACFGVLSLLRDNHIFNVSTFVDAENTASIRVLEKVGFVLEARKEKWFRFINQGEQAKDCLLFRLPM